MSKRHQIQTGDNWHQHIIPPDIPFRDDLVFYAPLENPYCTHDYVSGIAPTTDTVSSNIYGYAVWDDSVNAYKCGFHQVNRTPWYYPAALKYNGLSLYANGQSIVDRGITVFIQDIFIRGDSVWPPIVTTDEAAKWVNVGDGAFCPIRRRDCTSVNTWTKMCFVYSSSTANWYRNGSLSRTSTWNNVHDNPTTLGIVQAIDGMSYEEHYVKDVRVYNRTLTESEIQQL